MTEVVALALVAITCWVFRIVFVVMVPADRLPRRIRRSLTYLAPAVLAGAAVAALTTTVTPTDPRGSVLALAAMIMVGLVAWRWRNLNLTVVVGLVAVLVTDLML